MKRIIIYTFISLFCANVFGQGQLTFNYSKCINNYWGRWYSSAPSVDIHCYNISGSYSNFIIHHRDLHPSQYMMKVIINNMVIETNKKKKKQRIKSQQWYEYTGIVEYYTYTTFENFSSIIENWPNGDNNEWQGAPNTSNGKKHTVNAIIKIAPYKNKPQCYNVFFEGIGLGLSLNQ